MPGIEARSEFLWVAHEAVPEWMLPYGPVAGADMSFNVCVFGHDKVQFPSGSQTPKGRSLRQPRVTRLDIIIESAEEPTTPKSCRGYLALATFSSSQTFSPPDRLKRKPSGKARYFANSGREAVT